MGIILPASEPTPYKVIETIDGQQTNESCFDKTPSFDVKVSDDQRKKLKGFYPDDRALLFFCKGTSQKVVR